MLRLAGLGLAGFLPALSGCGTLLHGERIGQPHSRDIDWKVAGLNGLGLVLFFVPGVIAFAVDFYNGTIYLPPDEMLPHDGSSDSHGPGQGWQRPLPTTTYAPTDAPASQRLQPNWQGAHSGELRRVTIDPNALDGEQIQTVVSDRTGRRIALLDGRTKVSELSRLELFATQCHRHQNDGRFGLPTREFFAER